MLADILVDALPQALPMGDRSIHAKLAGAFNGTVQCYPGHDLRIGVMPRLGAGFPDALIRLAPDASKVSDQGALQPPAGLVVAKAAATALVQRVHDFAKDVQLKLLRGGVADPNRFCPIVSG